MLPLPDLLSYIPDIYMGRDMYVQERLPIGPPAGEEG